jgi:23S rRNA (adenine2503-C2)-methyltransferase
VVEVEALSKMIKHTLPTGYLFADEYDKGMLETLSIGDYGKGANVKADFLGYTREINGVANVPCMPLSDKWVITLSTQYGCPMRCTFCDVPNIPFGGNATLSDLWQQLYKAIRMFPNVGYTERLNVHFARMGEPTYNQHVLDFAVGMYNSKRAIHEITGLRIETLHPVLTTSLPKANKNLYDVLMDWCDIKNRVYNGQAGLQISVNSTDERQRDKMFNGMAMTLEEFSKVAHRFPMPIGRKYCLNIAFSTDFIVDAEKLKRLFDPRMFMVKITPIHNNTACRDNGIVTVDGYASYRPYSKLESELKEAGFDVLVFVPSMDEEDGLVTCGNVVLGGGCVKTNAETPNIMGGK